MKLCHTCERNAIDYSDDGNPEEAKWIKKEGLDPVPVSGKPKEIKLSHPAGSDIQVTILDSGLKKGTKILYWAANPKKLTEADDIGSALVAYGRKGGKKVKNYGCVRVGKDGKLVLKIVSPRCYMEKGTIWPKHIHFVKEEDGDWKKSQFYTVLGIPSVTKNVETKRLKYGNVYVTPETIKKTWKGGKYYMVYALSSEYPSLVDLKRYNDGYKHVRIDHSSKRIAIPKEIKKSTPLVVYCAKESCDASKKLLVKLADRGYENLFYMDTGMLGFSKESFEIFTEKGEKRVRGSYKKLV